MPTDPSPSEPEALHHAILEHVNHPNYRPVKPKVIAKRLGLPKERVRDLRRAIKRLVQSGRLHYGGNHLVRAVTEVDRREFVVGTFSRTSRGFGFVRPSDTARAAGQSEDVYVPASRTMDAANGDLVKVKLARRGPDPTRRRGRIVEVVSRATRRFVGTYHRPDGEPMVTTSGRAFSHPIPVGDPGAKDAREGDLVVIEMVHFPEADYAGEAVIVESLGRRGQPGVDTLAIIREFALPESFAEESLQAARVEADRFDETNVDGRTDLTDEVVITIDPQDARDFDDAISLERLENGHWRLGVHIADVSHFVRPGTPLDEEARQRGTSVYLPDRVIPMLPELISNGLASLQPRRVRYAKSLFIELTPEGARVDVEARNTAIMSKQRFAYEEIDEYLADPQPWRTRWTTEICRLVDRMRDLAMTLRKRRRERGAIELVLPEVKIEFDAKGRVSGARRVEHTVSHQIIEEFMLAANEAVAELLNDRGIHVLRRVHEAPDPRKLRSLTRFVRELGIPCESLESRFEIIRLIDVVQGQPEQQAVNLAVLKSMQKAEYSPAEEGHYALNSPNYCHFTSPIRRYPDLVVHRLLNSLLLEQRADDALPKLTALGSHCSDRERRAEEAERELVKLKLLSYMSRRVGRRLSAVITGVERFGVFAQGVELPAEGMITVESLRDDHYRYEEETRTLAGFRSGNRFRLGDAIEVEVGHVDLDRRELRWVYVRHLEHRSARVTGRSDSGESQAGRRRKGSNRDAGKRGGKGPRKKRRR